jgi:DNA-binding NtrC family response regulator
LRPDIPIILTTGYSERISEEKAKTMGIKELLMKPVGLRALAATVRRVLDEGRSDTVPENGHDARNENGSKLMGRRDATGPECVHVTVHIEPIEYGGYYES